MQIYSDIANEEFSMVCHRISELLGLGCHPLTDDGLVAMIDSPCKYSDGDDVPIFIEKFGSQIRVFDDGGAVIHLLGLGMSLDDQHKIKFLKELTEPFHVNLNDAGEFEIWAPETGAPAAVANFISSMLTVDRWQSDVGSMVMTSAL